VLAYINAIPLETYMGGTLMVTGARAASPLYSFLLFFSLIGCAGVLKCSGVKPSLDHVVSIIGWGLESGVPYWICTNR
jgi:hypothetical protein